MSDTMRLTCLAIHSADNYPGMPQWRFSLAFAYLQAALTPSPCYERLSFTHLNFYEYHTDATIQAALRESQPDLLAISCYVWNFNQVQRLLHGLQQEWPQLLVVLGGPEISADSQWVMERYPAVKFMVVGEGEITFRTLLETLLTPEEGGYGTIKGLFWRSREGEIHYNGPAPMIDPLDALPSPYLLGLIPPAAIQQGLAPLETQRGCILDCAFCNYQKGFKNVRYFALPRVMAELAWILQQHPRQLYLMDPAFNSNRRRAAQILQVIAHHRQQGMRVQVNAEMIPDILTPELMRLCGEAGMGILEMGVQSLTPTAVATMRRYRNEEKLFRAFDLAKENRIIAVPQIIFGLPGDSLAGFLATFDRVYALATPELDILHLLVLPGTHYRQQAEHYGLVYEDHPPYALLASHDFSREEITLLRRFAKVVLVLLPMKEAMLHLCQELVLPPHQPFLKFLEGWREEKPGFHWPVHQEEDRRQAVAMVGVFLDFLQKNLLSLLPEPRQSALHEQFRRAAKRCAILLSAHLLTRRNPL
ncbi:MAG: cobalamin-dependent protein [Magnetococcales bacterium]|nr:cobalamin-dependent protein [Magnetococcales bacterium]